VRNNHEHKGSPMAPFVSSQSDDLMVAVGFNLRSDPSGVIASRSDA
jgi:hypothetical protein